VRPHDEWLSNVDGSPHRQRSIDFIREYEFIGYE
jgi:hypothetical protein